MAKNMIEHSESEFQTEEALARAFNAEAAIKQKMSYRDWNSWEAREVQGLFGVPDNLLVLWKTHNSGRRALVTVSFEYKKEKWKRALVQAYRYSAFSDYSCVVMDAVYVHRALSSIERFKRSNIGLLDVSKNGFVRWHFVPILRKPYSGSTRRALLDAIEYHLFGKSKQLTKCGPNIKWIEE